MNPTKKDYLEIANRIFNIVSEFTPEELANVLNITNVVFTHTFKKWNVNNFSKCKHALAKWMKTRNLSEHKGLYVLISYFVDEVSSEESSLDNIIQCGSFADINDRSIGRMLEIKNDMYEELTKGVHFFESMLTDTNMEWLDNVDEPHDIVYLVYQHIISPLVSVGIVSQQYTPVAFTDYMEATLYADNLNQKNENHNCRCVITYKVEPLKVYK